MFEAIEKVDRPKNTSNPKEILSQESTQNAQEPVILFADPGEILKALTSTPSESLSARSPPSLNSAKNIQTFVLPNGIWLGSPWGPKSASIGTDVKKGAAVTIGDKERCGGVYVLGQPRTGKSDLLVSLALGDIERGHGILFIDPHTDAINDLIARIPPGRRGDIILLDPTLSSYRFGINLLRCDDPTDGDALDRTWGRVRDIFVKVWETEKGQLGFWLDKILRNSVYLLLENPGVTLVELPLLLQEDTTFRNSLIANVRVKHFVKDFWYYEFDRLSRRDRTEQVGPALNRLSVFRDIDVVRDIVGQDWRGKAPIDFQTVMREGKIVLLRLPTNLSSDVKHLIGTMLLSEITHAAFERDKVPEPERTYFGIYCDEFQEFASPDFARLFTQTGKYKVMPVVAHQTRLGQFRPGDPNQGATLASPNKVLFTLSPADAREFAPEFAEKPPTEMRDEDVYIISQHPFYDLIHGHRSPDVRCLVDRYIRPIKDRLDDIYGDRETERLIRTDYLDEASLYRIDERIEATLTGDVSLQRGILGGVAREISRAKSQTDKLKQLNEEGILIRATIRLLNRLFIDVMEGKLDRGQEAFSNRLIEISKAAILPDEDRRILELYIAYAYGGCGRERILPFEVAKRQGLFKEYVEKTEREISAEYEAKTGRFASRIWNAYNEHIVRMMPYTKKEYAKRNAERRSEGDWYYRIEDFKRDECEKCDDAIYLYNKGALRADHYKDDVNYELDMYQRINEIVNTSEPAIRRKPADIALRDIRAMRFFADMYELSMRKDLTTRGYSDIVESIDGLAKLCEYLVKPDNHLQVKSRQRTQREVPTRTVADMVNEMAGKLTELPRYEAFVKVVEEKGGEAAVWKGRIRRQKLPDAPAGALEEAMKVVVERAVSYCRPRGQIEEEIRKRQADWRRASASQPAAKTQRAAQPQAKPVDPPPTRTSTRLPGDS